MFNACGGIYAARGGKNRNVYIVSSAFQRLSAAVAEMRRRWLVQPRRGREVFTYVADAPSHRPPAGRVVEMDSHICLDVSSAARRRTFPLTLAKGQRGSRLRLLNVHVFLFQQDPKALDVGCTYTPRFEISDPKNPPSPCVVQQS